MLRTGDYCKYLDDVCVSEMRSCAFGDTLSRANAPAQEDLRGLARLGEHF